MNIKRLIIIEVCVACVTFLFWMNMAHGQSFCVGDCNQDGTVTIDEVVTAVNIALGTTPLSACPAADCIQGHGVLIVCLLDAVNNALYGTCQVDPGPTPTATPSTPKR